MITIFIFVGLLVITMPIIIPLCIYAHQLNCEIEKEWRKTKMSKAIMISIKPKYVAQILNGEKTIEIRKTCPVQLRGDTPVKPEPIDVYIYCTKDKEKLVYVDYTPFGNKGYITTNLDCENNEINGKVVAKFTLNKVEEVKFFMDYTFGGIYNTESYPNEKCFERDCCLTQKELDVYINKDNYKRDKIGYAWHISNLVIFDKPKELWQFKTLKEAVRYSKALNQAYEDDAHINERLCEGLAEDNECANTVQLTELTEFMWGIKKAPQSWCYVEVLL